jgi:hypothetical protein
MSGPAEILCSRCGTPFPKDKGKTAVTCVVCGQLRPDLDLTLDDDDEDLGAALGGGAGGGAVSSVAGSVTSISGGGGGGGGSGSLTAGMSMGSGAPTATPAPAMDPETHVLRVASAASTGGIDTPPAPPSSTPFRVDHPYMTMQDAPGMFGDTGRGRRPMTGERLVDRVGPVLLVVCPLAVGMAGGLNMMSRTDDFSLGTWYAVGAVFAAMVIASLFLGMVATGLLYVVRLRWTPLLRVVFIAAAGAVCYYGMNEVPSHILVRPDALPGFVVRK